MFFIEHIVSPLSTSEKLASQSKLGVEGLRLRTKNVFSFIHAASSIVSNEDYPQS
jgi:hypothetical protein